MILQNLYHVVSKNSTKVTMENCKSNVVTISLSDWREMNYPEEVSVTIMRLQERKAV